MLADPWQFALVAVLVATNVAVSYWLYRRLRTPGAGSPLGPDHDGVAAESPPGDPADETAEPGPPDPTATDHRTAESGTVACPACGTPNDPEYRFCRACVAELTASGVVGDGGSDRAGGLPR
jgi:hypothetical protein